MTTLKLRAHDLLRAQNDNTYTLEMVLVFQLSIIVLLKWTVGAVYKGQFRGRSELIRGSSDGSRSLRIA